MLPIFTVRPSADHRQLPFGGLLGRPLIFSGRRPGENLHVTSDASQLTSACSSRLSPSSEVGIK